MDQAQILKIVVASPGDVQAERKALPAVVEELNRGIAADRGLRLEVTRWEIDAYAGFHIGGPQGLIDGILRIPECDIFIGIFWKRFGTPTADGTTGTEHEFKLAYQSWQEKGRPHIALYFNQRQYMPQSEEESLQQSQVLRFKKLIPPEGLWWDYKGKAEFKDLVRDHLTKYILKLSPPIGDSPAPRKKDELKSDAAHQRSADELIQAYRDKLAENISRVRLLGEAESRELKEVFVELSIVEEYQRPSARNEWLGFVDAALRERRALFGSRSRDEQENSTGSGSDRLKRMIRPDELLRDGTRAVITGAPGCGKSTLLRWLAGKSLPENSPRLPVFLELKRIKPSVFDNCRDLVELLFEQAIAPLLHFEPQPERERLKTEFASRLAANRVAIFLDGLDEVRNTAFFQPLCDAINHFIGSAYGKNLLIISTRPYALDVRFEGAKEMEIAPLSQRQVAEFLRHYYGNDPKLDVSTLIQKLQRRELGEMIRVPVLLGAVVQRYRKQGELTGDKLKLYEGLVRDLAVKLDAEKGVDHFLIRDDDGERKLDFLRRAAFDKLFAEQVENDAERLTFDADWLRKEAEAFCAPLRLDPYNFAADVKATPLLREVAEETWAFSHLTIQEYLAASALSQHPDCERIFCRAYFNPTLVEMEALPMMLGMVSKPGKFYQLLERFPESLDFKGLRLRARGIGYGSRVSQQTREELVNRFAEFVEGKGVDESAYSSLVATSFSATAGEAADLLRQRLILLSSTGNESVKTSAITYLANFDDELTRSYLLKKVFDRDEYSVVRTFAFITLQEIGGGLSDETLLELTGENDWGVRQPAVASLSRRHEKMVTEMFIRNLKDKDSNVRQTAVENLGGLKGERAVGGLIEALRDEDEDVRFFAASALAEAIQENNISVLIAAMQDDLVSFGVESALEWLDQRRAEILLDAIAAKAGLSSESPLEELIEASVLADSLNRVVAVYLLGRLAVTSTIPSLSRALRDPITTCVRSFAARGLIRIGGEAVIRILIKGLYDSDTDLRERAAEALGQVGSTLAEADLCHAVKDVEDKVRVKAVEALGKMGGHLSVAYLIEALRDEASRVRSEAAEALRLIDNEALTNGLLLAMSHQNSFVRKKAAEVIGYYVH